eukprot:3794-Heterococcus_DN1.PRE.7
MCTSISLNVLIVEACMHNKGAAIARQSGTVSPTFALTTAAIISTRRITDDACYTASRSRELQLRQSVVLRGAHTNEHSNVLRCQQLCCTIQSTSIKQHSHSAPQTLQAAPQLVAATHCQQKQYGLSGANKLVCCRSSSSISSMCAAAAVRLKAEYDALHWTVRTDLDTRIYILSDIRQSQLLLECKSLTTARSAASMAIALAIMAIRVSLQSSY